MTDIMIEVDCGTGEATERPLTPEEQATLDAIQAANDAVLIDEAWVDLYVERGLRLSACDWVINSPTDLPSNVQDDCNTYEDDWLIYRQSLRDMPEATVDPTDPVWPTPPPAPLLPISDPETVRAWRARKGPAS
jgi:hypothetical protein